ncbi:MAG: hypothetical protein NWF08_06695 [Candidatus Bathyarchaeota archaeon]|nr:hypothetical protein [Candidatus Bathyarchaeota archaeon]
MKENGKILIVREGKGEKLRVRIAIGIGGKRLSEIPEEAMKVIEEKLSLLAQGLTLQIMGSIFFAQASNGDEFPFNVILAKLEESATIIAEVSKARAMTELP